jgi:hypothetical protein
VLHVSSDDQEREQSSEDYPNVEAHQNSSVLRSSRLNFPDGRESGPG